MKRPILITVIAWILIVTGGISLITNIASLNNPMVKELIAKSPIPILVQYVMMYIGLLVLIVGGIGMLKKQNWARFLYVMLGTLEFLIGLFTSPLKNGFNT